MPKVNSNAFKKRPNITVVPLQIHETAPLPTSPRNSSKVKIKLVSPSAKNNSSAFKTNNCPRSPSKNEKQDKKLLANIELGGKTPASPTHQRDRSSEEISHYSLQSSQWARSSSRQQIARPTTVLFRYSGNLSQTVLQPRQSLNQCIFSQTMPSPARLQQIQEVPASKFQSNSKQVSKATEIRSKPSSHYFPSELAIKEENTMENLKESYECDMQEIKKLQEQITSNNKEIKELLKSSQASRKGQSSKKGTIENIEKDEGSIHRGEDEREPSIWSHEENREKDFVSKKTLINDLKFQSIQELEKPICEPERDEVSVQTDSCLPSNPNAREGKSQRLSLSENKECQMKLVMVAEKEDMIQVESLKASIIRHHESNTNINAEKQQKQDVYANSGFKIDEQRDKTSLNALNSISSSKIPRSATKIQNENVFSQQIYSKTKIEKKIDEAASHFKIKDIGSREQSEESPIPVSQQILPEFIPSSQQEQIKIKKQLPLNSLENVFLKESRQAKVQEIEAKQGLRRISNKIYL